MVLATVEAIDERLDETREAIAAKYAAKAALETERGRLSTRLVSLRADVALGTGTADELAEAQTALNDNATTIAVLEADIEVEEALVVELTGRRRQSEEADLVARQDAIVDEWRTVHPEVLRLTGELRDRIQRLVELHVEDRAIGKRRAAVGIAERPADTHDVTYARILRRLPDEHFPLAPDQLADAERIWRDYLTAKEDPDDE